MLKPTFAGFLAFVRDDMHVPASAIPDDSPWLPLFYAKALEWACIPCYEPVWQAAPVTRMTLVYNLAASFMVQMAPDRENSTWFADLRKQLGVGRAVAGVVGAASDQGTSGMLQVSDALRSLSLADLMLFQDQWGRTALAILGELSSLWGYTP